MNNKGVVSIEAAISFPLFLFTMLALILITETHTVRGIVYEGAVETAEYMAEYSYLDEPNILMPGMVMSQYIDNKELVNESIDGGIKGIDYFGTITRDSDNYVVLKVNYTLNVDIPMMPSLSKKRQIIIKQRAYIGEGEDNGKDECPDEDKYVYVTDNREVYHSSRNCTHLKLSIHQTSLKCAQNYGFSPCEFCGDKAENTVYITDEGGRYHSSKACSGLKRTVYIVKLSEVSGLPACSRCCD